MNWKTRITKDDKYIDLSGIPYYELEYDEKPKTVKIYEYDVAIPKAPADKDCINYGLSEHDQIFRRTLIPKQVLNPNKDWGIDNWSQENLEAFVDAEWNRRRNGIWMFIKGKKTFIPPLLYMKMNYWKSITGVEFLYKFSDWEFFMFWLHCIKDPKCNGMADFKCRQLGDTENAILIMWEYGSRVRGTINANQSCINENHAKRTFVRLVYGNKKMLWFFRPINQGTEDPKKGLNMSYPVETITAKNIREKIKSGEMANKSSADDYEYPEIGSQFYYAGNNTNEFDGATLGRAYLDEFGKSSKRGIDPVEWIRVVKEALYSKILDRKMGMMLLTSTVEEISAESLELAQKVWKQADPSKRNAVGQTTNGLYRCFRNAVDRGAVDRWGFPKKDQIIQEIESTYNALMESGDVKGAISYKRKNCLTIEDVFSGAGDISQFNIEKLQKRLYFIQNEAKPRYVRGNFKWQDGIQYSNVIWEPDSNGRWTVSIHPKDLGLSDNAKLPSLYSPKPANIHHFCAGVDPIDQSDTLESEENRSKAGIVVKAKLNVAYDGGKEKYYDYEDTARGIYRGNPINDGHHFITNRIACCYLARPNDPMDFFDDVVKTVVYYGTDFLPEKNKFGGLHTYLKNCHHELYIMDMKAAIKNYKGQSETDGLSATTQTINTYFELLATLCNKWTNTIDHPDLLEQLLTMNWDNRGKRDLGVAAGFCEIADSLPRLKYQQHEQSEIQHYTEHEL